MTGKANLWKNILTIKVFVNRGEHVTHYVVERLKPDTRVASVAISLMKGEYVDDAMLPTGDVWHVAVDEWGPRCDCPHAVYVGANSQAVCKHVLAARAVGLI